MSDEEMICTYPTCEAKALYKCIKGDRVAYLCREHYLELKALGMVHKAYRLTVPPKEERGDKDENHMGT